ncbi:MAG: nitrate/sulfonate/bicarbonate ABC transporter ATP-binding protein [Acidobacteriaceae bacterium]|nr:nitrate/sulfonate/bicarbonate ABC transporter ATP-binding protein [Acidobacteriaceae bacterium]
MDELAETAPGVGEAGFERVARPSRTARTAETIVEAIGIEKSFPVPAGGSIQVIAPLTLRIHAGEIVALLGPSGSGKSTLLRILSGLTPASEGEVIWNGTPLAQCAPNVAIVFQSFALFPWLTVTENVQVPLLARGMERSERESRALACIRSVGLQAFENAYPKELSGGMKQRVGFARALAVEPEILFMDEPFSALDVLTADNLRGELLELWLGRKITTRSIFLVTHNIEEAVLLADRIIVLGRNPARIRADFPLPLKQPRQRNSAEFLIYVDYIYKLITQPELRAAPPAVSARDRKPSYVALPHARPGAIAGLLELVMDHGGQADLYRIAEQLHMEIDDLLPIVEAAALLSFAKLEKGDVEVTPAGSDFAQADIATRKLLFRNASLESVPLLQQINNTLTAKSDHMMPLEFFRDILDEHLAQQEVDRQIETAINWGRYAGLFLYDADNDTVYLSRNL